MTSAERWTLEEIERFLRANPSRTFTPSSCGGCNATANVLAGGPYWQCEACGRCNVLYFGDIDFALHDAPDQGPPAARIRAAVARARPPETDWWR